MSLRFAGPISPEAQHKIRALYLWYIPWAREVLVLGGVFALACVAFPHEVAGYVFLISDADFRQPTLVERVQFLPLAAFFFFMAFRLYHWWWRWWWPKLEQSCGERLLGDISIEGVRWGAEGSVIPWRRFIRAKLSDEVALLYLTKAYALPFHTSMFQDPVAWEAFRSLLEKSGVRISHFSG